MPPKKPDPKDKKGVQQQLIDDDYSDLPTLPPLNNYIFNVLYAFKYKKNLQEVQKHLLKHYSFPQEDVFNYQKFKVIQREDIINYAKLKQYITEEESMDLIAKIGQEKLIEIMAKTTVDLVMSFEVPARRLKKESNTGSINEENTEVEMTIWLKDFPQNIQEFRALQQHKQMIHGIYVIEEKFIQDVEDDFTIRFSNPDPVMQRFYEEEEKQRSEEKNKIEFKPEERLSAFTTALEVGRYLKQSQDPEIRQCTISRFKFQGPDPPMIEGQDLEDVEAEQKLQEDYMYQQFARELKEEIEITSNYLQEYRLLKKKAKTVPLWPYPVDPEQQRLEEELRKQEEQRKKEEEKRQQELLEQQQKAAAAKGGKGVALNKAQAGQNSRMKLHSQQDQQRENAVAEEKKLEKKAKPNSQDDEDKDWQIFSSLDKILSELPQDLGSIGAILAAMVFQIDQEQHQNPKKTTAQKDNVNNNTTMQQLANDKQFFLKHEEQENQLHDYFEDIFNKLTVEHNIQESSFSHQYKDNNNCNSTGGSPYQSLFNENDKVNQTTTGYTFLNGESLSMAENKTLQHSQLPGINDRIGMPINPPLSFSQRDSDLSALLSFSPLPQSQTKRALMLKQCEKMLKQREPERDFCFMDRNFVEKFDATTLRQQLASVMRLGPDIATQYYPHEDALLMALYFKNPPGRLLRRQWTYKGKGVLPEFQQWKEIIKKEGLEEGMESLLEIESSKVGVLRVNSKYCFPCDNSIIRIDKNLVGNRRIGTSIVMKDNLIFGIRERHELFKLKQGHEDDLQSREAWFNSDRRCDFWLEFENNLRLLVEIVDKQVPHLEEIPLHEPLPPELIEQLQAKKEQEKEQEKPDIAEQQPALQIESVPVGNPKGSSLNKNASRKSLGRNTSQLKNQPPVKSPVNNAAAKEQQQTLQKNDSQKSIESVQGPSPQELAFIQKKRDEEQRLMSAFSRQQFYQDAYEPTKGSKLTFTFNSGLIVQILPNGDVSQSHVENPQEKKKYGGTIQDSKSANQQEKSRLICRNGQVIRYFLDGNMQILFPDGTITSTDKRKGVWFTVNAKGIKRVRKLQDNLVYDEPKRLKITEKIDPETNATIQVREDGVLIIKYIDEQKLVQMPDGTQILTKKDGQSTITLISKEGYVSVRQIFDPVKARARTVIGLGGTDSLMGRESIMERCNNGKVTEVLLPDRTVVQTYQERQELEGYNNFTTNMVHLIKRDDYSIIKVRQDGEIVLISANERAFLNSIGKNRDFPVNDFDYFFELFGIPSERRSGVYTANLNEGKLWTQDEEGNTFIVYANGDSVEKLSVSFNLDQMVEGIDRKEPDSPRFKDGEYVEEECKFLPPPKSIAPPRLFMIKNNMGYEFFNQEQLEYLFRCRHKDRDLIQSRKIIKIDNEEVMSHMFLRKTQKFSPEAGLVNQSEIPKIPQSVELINQTVSIPKEPVSEEFLWRNIVEFKAMDSSQINDFENAIKRYQQMRRKQQQEKERLKVVEIKSEEHREVESRIWQRIAQERGIDISQLVGEEYKPLKDIDNEEKRQKFLDDLEKFFSDDE